ncbi:MAG: mannonate dehydratase [Acidobacteriota bacterium]|nr:mannonate dehydratase [Acidobacteriota bacterium]
MKENPSIASSRRGFVRATIGAAALSAASADAAKRPLEPLSPGMKISYQLGSNFTPEDLTFAKQIGVEYLSIGTTGGTYDMFADMKKRVEAAGLKVANIGNTNVHNMSEVTLNLPGRDQKIEEYKQYLRNLGKAGIYYTTYAHMGNGIWSSAPETTRGGAPARAFHENNAKGYWAGKVFTPPITNGRKFSKDEIWENYTYFIKQVVPVAEEVGVRIGIHPDDPPVPELGGVPRCIFGNFDGYVRAMKIANSPNVGVCLCCGTWMEGGKYMGKNVFEAVREFSKMGKLWKIHFRNVSAPIPDFVEAYVDNGYTDMKKLMRTLADVDYRGILIADHVPRMVGDGHTGWAFSLGYIRALHDMALDERRS